MRYRDVTKMRSLFDKADWKIVRFEANDFNKWMRKQKRLMTSEEWEELHLHTIGRAHTHVFA